MERLSIVEKRFTKLIVIKFSHIKNGNSYWKCKCACGNTKIVAGYHLKNGDTKSCGCLKIYKHPEGMTGLNTLYRTYKRNALKNNRTFSLTIEEFKEITSKDCFYCGIKPSTVAKTIWDIKDKNKLNHTVYNYNGIDRIDSTKDYEKTNIVPCCKWCNIAKSNKTVSEFKEHIFKMYDYLKESTK
jgi:hypothetical protein